MSTIPQRLLRIIEIEDEGSKILFGLRRMPAMASMAFARDLAAVPENDGATKARVMLDAIAPLVVSIAVDGEAQVYEDARTWIDDNGAIVLLGLASAYLNSARPSDELAGKSVTT